MDTRRTFLFAVALLAASFPSRAQETGPTGTIKGIIVDAESRQHLPGGHIMLKGTHLGSSADSAGRYTITNVPVGSYTLVFSSIGYAALSRTDVVVSSARTSFADAEMQPVSIAVDDVVVSGGYFASIDAHPLSAATFSSEEIRRQAGSAGDISRILFGLPSMAKTNDARNSLIVRGGSALENGFYLDNIEIPNINHFPTQGSSDGPIGLLNVEFIRDVKFSAGGFSPAFGDKLSSVTEIAFREGNRDRFLTQLDVSMEGMGASAEGPFGSGKGSWFLSARRSYLDLIFHSINFGGPVPRYGDFQGKAVYDLSDRQKISVIGLMSLDHVAQSRNDALQNKNNMYQDYSLFNNTLGINWQYLAGKSGYAEVSYAHTTTKTTGDYSETVSGLHLLDNRSNEEHDKLRNNNHLRISSRLAAEFGAEAEYVHSTYVQAFSAYTDRLGRATPPLAVDRKIRSLKAGVFLQGDWKPLDRLTIAPGGRVDYFRLTGRSVVSPRISATYEFSPTTSLSGSAGLFYQDLPLVLLAQQEEFRQLRDPRADHYVLGLSHLLTESTRLTVELYDKEYWRCPMDPSQPELFVLDEAADAGIIMNHERLLDNGRAFSRGVEVTVQKKLAENIYGIVAGSLFRARYRDLNGVWRDRLYDNKVTVTVEGGYRLDESWEFSLRWLFAGGAPYTPFDEAASSALQRGVYDRSLVNMARLPDYHSLNIRTDRRFHFAGSTLVTYLSIWNAYGRHNVSQYAWNEIENRKEPQHMWGTFPVFGIEYKF